eukprot:10245374-Lingulodinium_polyedra.AAC.1
MAHTAFNASCKMALRGKWTSNRTTRATVLALRGARCREIYQDFLNVAREFHFDLSRASANY